MAHKRKNVVEHKGNTKTAKPDKKTPPQPRNKLIARVLLLFFAFYLCFFGCYTIVTWNSNRIQLENIRMTISELLLKHVQVIQDFMEAKQAIESLIKEQPLSDLLKTRLRPIQERVASLRTQTSQYEKMEKIPGGPKSFIRTASLELNSILDNQMHQLHTEMLNRMGDYTNRMKENKEKAQKAVKSHDQISSIDPIALTGLHSDSITLWDPQEPFAVSNESDDVIPIVIEKLTELANLYQDREQAYDKMVEWKKKIDPNFIHWQDMEGELNYGSHLKELLSGMEKNTSTQVLVEKLANAQMKIENTTEKNIEIYQKTMPTITKQVREVTKLLVDMSNLDSLKKKPYFQLKTMIQEDITKLQFRIVNMQYKVLKFVPDE